MIRNSLPLITFLSALARETGWFDDLVHTVVLDTLASLNKPDRTLGASVSRGLRDQLTVHLLGGNHDES
jgi:hypothetical protein